MGLTCKICFENASSHAPPRVTPCGHVFCQPCSATWFRSDAACPVCRQAVDGPSSLISLYDQDAGLQSSPFGLGDDGVEILGDAVPNRDFSSSELGPRHGREDEDVHVKYILGKVGERWQHVMIERARLKVQVALLEQRKQDLLAQLQRVTDDNTALRDLLDGRSLRARNMQFPDKCHEPWEARIAADAPSNHRNGDSETSPAHRICYPDPYYTGLDLGKTRNKPPEKILERLEASNWELVRTFQVHSGPVHGIAVSPSGNLVATASWDHLCKVYDVHLEEEVAVLSGHELGLYAVKFSPANWDLVGTVSSDHTCRLWNAENGECLRVLEGHTDEVNGLAFENGTHTGTHLLATASDDMSSKIWDVEKGSCVTNLKGHRHGVYGVCFQPQGHLVATASFDLTAKLWDPRSADSVYTLRGHLEDVIGVDFDSSGNILATGSDDRTCRVWDIRTGQVLEVLEEHCGEVKRVVFSPFSRLLATTCGDTTVRLFDTSTFECIHVLSSHSDHVFDVAWSPTAEFLVTASHDHLWKLWLPKMPPLGYSLLMSNI